MALSVIQTTALSDWMMTKDVTVIYFLRYCPGICLEGLKKAMRNLNQEGQCPDQDTKRTSTEYKSNANLLSPNYFVSILNMLYFIQQWTGDLQNVGLN
jgi:hypothetical protein